MLNKAWKRLILVAVVWIAFGVASSIYYMTYIHDVGGTWWAMKIFALPVVLVLIQVFDYWLTTKVWFSSRPNTIGAIDCLFAILLWFEPIGFVFIIGMLIGSIF
ncbi:hypothetical protein ACFL19_00545 [Pseudomonadota bacterium]